MTPEEKSMLLGAAITAGFGLAGIAFKKVFSWAVSKSLRSAIETEFAPEIKRGRATEEAVKRVESTVDGMAVSLKRLDTNVEGINNLLRGFAQQIGQLQGATDIIPPDKTD